MQLGKMDAALKPLCWLIGQWKSISAVVNYPTMPQPVHYCEDLQFKSVGQPLLSYTSSTWHPKTKEPMHLESGYLRIGADGRTVVLLSAQNFGCVTVEEGTVKDKTISVRTVHIGLGKILKGEFTELQRYYRLNDDGRLEMALFMATPKVKLTKHLTTLYEKVK